MVPVMFLLEMPQQLDVRTGHIACLQDGYNNMTKKYLPLTLFNVFVAGKSRRLLALIGEAVILLHW